MCNLFVDNRAYKVKLKRMLRKMKEGKEKVARKKSQHGLMPIKNGFFYLHWNIDKRSVWSVY